MHEVLEITCPSHSITYENKPHHLELYWDIDFDLRLSVLLETEDILCGDKETLSQVPFVNTKHAYISAFCKQFYLPEYRNIWT